MTTLNFFKKGKLRFDKIDQSPFYTNLQTGDILSIVFVTITFFSDQCTFTEGVIPRGRLPYGNVGDARRKT